MTQELGLPLAGFDNQPKINVTINGAAEVDPDHGIPAVLRVDTDVIVAAKSMSFILA